MSTDEQGKSVPARTADREADGGIRSWYGNSRSFLTEVRNEMRRVTWPSRREVYATTIVVILVSSFFGVYLWLLDIGINQVVDWVYQRFGAA